MRSTTTRGRGWPGSKFDGTHPSARNAPLWSGHKDPTVRHCSHGRKYKGAHSFRIGFRPFWSHLPPVRGNQSVWHGPLQPDSLLMCNIVGVIWFCDALCPVIVAFDLDKWFELATYPDFRLKRPPLVLYQREEWFVEHNQLGLTKCWFKTNTLSTMTLSHKKPQLSTHSRDTVKIHDVYVAF